MDADKNSTEGSKMDGICERRSVISAVSVFLVFALVWGTLTLFVAEDAVGQEEELILRIGSQDEMKTRNILASNDIWTENVLGPVYDSVLHTHPETGELLPYILKGTDVNGDGDFDESEYGVFTSVPGRPLEVTAFYDFNGVRFHDGYQATVEDLLVTYHMDANDPKATSLDVLKDRNNIEGNYTTSKWLWLYKLKGFDPESHWHAEKPWSNYDDPDYNTSLRAAVHFVQQVPYANFYRYTMSMSIMPSYLWEGTGCIYNRDLEEFTCNIHRKGDGTVLDFGVAYDPDLGNGNPGPSPKAFDFDTAESWDLPDEYVIGTGPFKFETWQKGAFASLTKNEDFYEGEPYIHKPYIDRMLFKIYWTTQTAVFALKSGDIDYIAWSIPPAFVPELANDPNVAIVSSPEKGFFYLSYNMRMEPFGYPDGNPANGDTGANFRQAVAYLIDRDTIVSNLLQNYGIVADGPVSPSLARWYNSSLPTYGYDEGLADSYLDTYSPPWDPSMGPCLENGDGCRSFPEIGTGKIEILTPAADYDPIRAAAGILIAQAMRKAGINAESKATAFGQIIQRIDARDFQMYISSWRIASDPPEYLHDFFYSRNVNAGKNLPGYQSDEFDEVIVRARQEIDLSQQISLIKQAQGILANDRPYDYLYFRMSIEAYRSDRFINWTVGAHGSIYHFWSWLGIHELPPESLRIMVSIPSSVKTDRTASLRVTVRDPHGNLLPGATVSAFVYPTNGNFVYQSVTSNLISGETDINGQFTVTYLPLALAAGDPKRIVLVHTQATHSSYSDSRNATVSITVYPLGVHFLSLLVDLPDGDTVVEGSTALLRVEVIDQDSYMVSGANVTITATPPAAIAPNSGTTNFNGWVNGVEYIEFESSQVDRDTQYTITIRATLTDYELAQMDVSLTVVNNYPPLVMMGSPSSGATLSGSGVVKGTASDPDWDGQLVRVEVRIDNGMWQNATGTTNWSFELDTTQLENGNHVLHVRAYDGVEYSQEVMLSFTVDNISWLWIAVGIIVPVVVVATLFFLLRKRGQTPQPYAPTQSTDSKVQFSGSPPDLERP